MPPVLGNFHEQLATNPMSKTRNGFLILVGDGFSSFGTWIDFLAILTLAAYQYHVTPYQMALVSAAGLLPGILLARRIGRLCDEADPKQILLWSIALRVGATGAILFCHDYTLFVALVGMRSIFAGVAPSAINVLAIRTVEPTDRPRFYAVLNVLNNTAKVLAPAIGTVSSSLANEGVTLMVSLAFSVASLFTFALVHVQSKPIRGAFADEQARGAAPDITPLLWIAATYAFFVFMVNNLIPLVLQQSGFDKGLLGILVSCSGAGNILSGLWLARKSGTINMRGHIREMMRPAMLQAIGFGAIGCLLWLGSSYATVVLAGFFFVTGTVSARYAIAMNVYLSTHYENSIGTVSGVVQAWQNSMILVAPLVGALILDSLGVPALFAFSVGTAAVSFALFFALQAGGLPRLQTPEPA